MFTAAVRSSGHNIGYHYETLSRCNGDREAALIRFEGELASLRSLAPVTTACMHGAPLSPHDNADLLRGGLWRRFDLLGDPIFTAFVLLSLTLAVFCDVNLNSMHHFYRGRLAHAFLPPTRA